MGACRGRSCSLLGGIVARLPVSHESYVPALIEACRYQVDHGPRALVSTDRLQRQQVRLCVFDLRKAHPPSGFLQLAGLSLASCRAARLSCTEPLQRCSGLPNLLAQHRCTLFRVVAHMSIIEGQVCIVLYNALCDSCRGSQRLRESSLQPAGGVVSLSKAFVAGANPPPSPLPTHTAQVKLSVRCFAAQSGSVHRLDSSQPSHRRYSEFPWASCF